MKKILFFFMIMVFNILNAGESGIEPKMVKENNNIIGKSSNQIKSSFLN